MKATDLIKFIHSNNIEYHWCNFPSRYSNSKDSEKDVVLFFHDYDLEDFRKVLSSNDYDIDEDSGLNVIMKDHYFCVRMKELCEYNDIDMVEVFGSWMEDLR